TTLFRSSSSLGTLLHSEQARPQEFSSTAQLIVWCKSGDSGEASPIKNMPQVVNKPPVIVRLKNKVRPPFSKFPEPRSASLADFDKSVRAHGGHKVGKVRAAFL